MLGGSNLIPFAKGAQGRIGKPDPINYPIPCCGAHSRPLWCRDVNRPLPSWLLEVTA
jgi:hypothetical protein